MTYFIAKKTEKQCEKRNLAQNINRENPLLSIPNEIFNTRIFLFLALSDIPNITLTCNSFFNIICRNDIFWKNFVVQNFSKDVQDFIKANLIKIEFPYWEFLKQSCPHITTQIFCFKNSTIFLRNNKLYSYNNCYLESLELNLETGEKILHVLNKNQSTYIQTNKNNIYVCGNNISGQLGVGHAKNVSTPTKMKLKLEQNEKILYVLNGGFHITNICDHCSTYIQTNKNNIYVCGNNTSGQLGVGNAKNLSTPTKMKLKLEENEKIKKLIVYERFIYIQTNKNNIYVCGNNAPGQLGVGHTQDVLTLTKMKLKLEENEEIKKLTVYKYSIYIQTNKNNIYVCGNNTSGQLGVGHAKNVSTPTKMKLTLEKNEEILQVLNGNYYCEDKHHGHSTHIQTNKNNIYVCGNNKYHQLGVEQTQNVSTPTKIKLKLKENEKMTKVSIPFHVKKKYYFILETNKYKYSYYPGYIWEEEKVDPEKNMTKDSIKNYFKSSKDEIVTKIIENKTTAFIQTNKNIYFSNENKKLKILNFSNCAKKQSSTKFKCSIM